NAVAGGETKTGATTQSRSFQAPAKGRDRTAPGRRPFRGVAGTASVATPWDFRPTFGRFGSKQKPMLTHGSGCQRAGSGPLVALVVYSVVQEGAPRHAAEAHHLAMPLDRRRGAKEEPTCPKALGGDTETGR